MRRLVEHHVAGHEILVRNAGGGNRKALGIDLRTVVEHHAGLVDDDDLAVGVDAAGDFRGIGADDCVQRDRVAVGLHEIDGLLTADIEALPVDGGALTGLVDGGGVAVLADGGLPADDGAAGGMGAGRQLGGGGGCEDDDEGGA